MKIAYSARDSTLRVCDLSRPNAEDAVLSVPGLRCVWPVWSPDGDLIAFSGYAGGSNGNAMLGVYVVRPDGTGPGLIYANEPGADAIARGTPHYCSWSPDASKLAFVAQTRAGLALFAWRADSDGSASLKLEGGPMYFTWSPDSEELYVHSFTGHHLVGASDGRMPRQFPGVSTQYMAPSWARDGGRIAFFLDADRGRQRLVTVDLDDQAVRVLTEFPGIAAVSWRPRHLQVGLVKTMIGSSGFYSGLTLIDCATGEQAELTDDPALAFYWSPDGSKVAYVTSSQDAEGSLRIGVVDVDAAERVYLPDFKPSREQLTHFMFFDQYAQSHSIWSPDSARLLIFGELGYHVARTSLSGRESNRAIVMDANGEGGAQEVARGFIGCWSP